MAAEENYPHPDAFDVNDAELDLSVVAELEAERDIRNGIRAEVIEALETAGIDTTNVIPTESTLDEVEFAHLPAPTVEHEQAIGLNTGVTAVVATIRAASLLADEAGIDTRAKEELFMVKHHTILTIVESDMQDEDRAALLEILSDRVQVDIDSPRRKAELEDQVVREASKPFLPPGPL